MAWVTPANITTGDLVEASDWNRDVVANPQALRDGAIAIASQAALDFIYASSATQLARLAAAAGKVPRVNAAGSAWAMAALVGELLKSGSGQTTSTSAETLDSVALSGLTALDTLLVFWNFAAVTQNSGNVELRNTTDDIAVSSAINPAAGDKRIAVSVIRQAQDGATSIDWLSWFDSSGDVLTGAAARATFTQNWTGSWTLGMRHAGVTAGGTLQWSWTALKIAGQ